MFGGNAVKPIETMIFRDINFTLFLTLFHKKRDPRSINRSPDVFKNNHKRHTRKPYKKHIKIQVRSDCRNYNFIIVKLCFWTSGGSLKSVCGAVAKL